MFYIQEKVEDKSNALQSSIIIELREKNFTLITYQAVLLSSITCRIFYS